MLRQKKNIRQSFHFNPHQPYKAAILYRIMFEASANPRSFTLFSGLNFTTSHSADDIGTTCGPYL
jgi:hypothetical protein